MRFYRVIAVLAISGPGALACSEPSNPDRVEASWISCQETPDCVSRGGTCEEGICRADNECASSADCEEGDCVPDENFGGLCAVPTSGPPVPSPAWPCASGADCPVGQGCGSDGLCHEDGECDDTADCGAGELCYNAGNDDPAGFCAAERPATNPYCRADGEGACRYECNTDGTCFNGATCDAGFCHWDDECVTADDCTPNHVCEPLFDYGISVCTEDEDPPCVDDGNGVCRYECLSSADCVVGGGCEADGFCHASNECEDETDCGPDEICYPDEHFGGLCGPERP